MRDQFAVTTPAADKLIADIETVKSRACFPTVIDADIVEAYIIAANRVFASYCGVAVDQNGAATFAKETCSDYWSYINAPAAGIGLSRKLAVSLIAVTEGGVRTTRLIEPEGGGDLEDNPAFAYRVNGAGRVTKLNASGGRGAWNATGPFIFEYEAGYYFSENEADYNVPEDLQLAVSLWIKRQVQELDPENYGRLRQFALTGIGSWQFELQSVNNDRGIASDVAGLLDTYRRLSH